MQSSIERLTFAFHSLKLSLRAGTVRRMAGEQKKGALMKAGILATQRPFPGLVEEDENPWFTRMGSPTTPLGGKGCGLATLEVCAGAGGQALGLEEAGIEHIALVEIGKNACATLRLNRPKWNVIEGDLDRLDCTPFKRVDIVSGGLPCPPFSVAGKQLGKQDERNLFPAMIRLVDQIRPRAVMIENVRGILEAVFEDYRRYIAAQFKSLGYQTGWKLLNASDFGVPQLRPRVVFVAVRRNTPNTSRGPKDQEFAQGPSAT
jgi:site-specific DNA-cytosine methylase